MSEGDRYPVSEDVRGLRVRVYPVNKAVQVFFLKSLEERALYLAHYLAMAGNPGGTRTYQNLPRQVFWLGMALAVYSIARNVG